MTTKDADDAIKFLELLLSHCVGGDAHAWRKCRRCLVFDDLRDHDRLAERFVHTAIAALRDVAIAPAMQAELDRLMSDNVELRRRLDLWEYDRKG